MIFHLTALCLEPDCLVVIDDKLDSQNLFQLGFGFRCLTICICCDRQNLERQPV